MKILHTSDWHLGARLGRHDRLADQRIAIAGLLDLARDVKPDLILHSGDVFDSLRPPYEAMNLGVRALTHLASLAPTVALCGNHDSPQLLKIIHEMAGMATVRRLWMVTRPEVLTIPGLDGVAVACVPFIPLTALADLASDEPARLEGNYADGIRRLNDRLFDDAAEQAGRDGIVLYAAHLHVHGARPGRSERRITVGEDYATHAEGLDRAAYCALGHIHDPQLLPGGTATGRYAGSIIPLDFGEAIQEKLALLVTTGDSGIQVDEHPLPAGRPLTEFTGTIDQFEARAASGAMNGHIVKARVRSDDPIIDLAERLLELSPECVIFELINVVANAQVKAIDTSTEPDREPSVGELFAEWRATAARGLSAPHEDVAAIFALATQSELATAADLGIRDVVKAAEGALEALAQARVSTTSQEK